MVVESADLSVSKPFTAIDRGDLAEVASKVANDWQRMHANSENALPYMTTEMAYRLFIVYCTEHQKYPISALVINEFAEKLASMVNRTANYGEFKVGDLRKMIKDLPDSLPVMIERSTTTGGESRLFDWDAINLSIIQAKEYQDEGAPEGTRLVESEGKHFLQCTLPFDQAFHARTAQDERSLKAFCIYSSY